MDVVNGCVIATPGTPSAMSTGNDAEATSPAPSFQHLEQRCVLRRDHHLDVQAVALRELAQQLVLEPHLFAAPQKEGCGTVSGDDA